MYDRSILASWRGNSGISIRHHASSELPLQQTETVARRVRCTPRFLQCTWQWRLRRQPARIPNRAASSPRWALRQSLWRMAYRRSRFHRDEHRAIIVGQKCTVTFLIGEHIGVPKLLQAVCECAGQGIGFCCVCSAQKSLPLLR